MVPALKRRKLSPPDGRDRESFTRTITEQDTPQDDFFIRASGWNLEQDYEQRPRKQKKKDRESKRLPIKTAEGRVEQLEVSPAKSEDEDSWLGSDVGVETQQAPSVIEEPVKVPIRQQITEAKEEMARIASLINEDPEEHAGGFRTLGSIAASSNATIKKLALAAQLTVYKDSIPGYRIRPIAEADQTEKVSKDVRRLRAFEQTLVSSYQGYIRDLAACAKSAKTNKGETTTSVASVAISCACALLLAVPHFNFREDLLKILISKLSNKKRDTDFSKCQEAITSLFQNDKDGGSSLNAVSLITRMMKARNYLINESVLNTFLHLRLLSEFTYKASQNRIDKPTDDRMVEGKKLRSKKEFRTKKQRKIMKERKVIEKEFKEADTTISHEQRDRMQSETLKLVFVTYFRILKARTPHLMGAVLEGLAKYAHLINQDFFGDILEALKDLISDAETFLDPEADESDAESGVPTNSKAKRDYVREALLCTTTAFTLLEGQDVAKAASTLHLDLTFFTSHLYRHLHTLSLNPDLELSSKSLRLADPHSPSPPPVTHTDSKINLKTTTVLLLRALASTLTPRTTPPVRVAAFTKQLFTSALQLPEKSALGVLGLMQSVLKVHGKKIAALWDTEERRGNGLFDALGGGLEGSNPFASTVWEGELLRLHYAPGVRKGIKGIETVVRDLR